MREVNRAAFFSSDKMCRYWLMRHWGTGLNLVFVGANPSTADNMTDDPTVRRWTNFANAWGYGSFKAVNLCPYRSPEPRVAKAWMEGAYKDPTFDDKIAVNYANVIGACQDAAKIVACWGNVPWLDKVKLLINDIEKIAPVYCFGRTMSGAPIHPMARGRNRISDDTTPVLWKP